MMFERNHGSTAIPRVRLLRFRRASKLRSEGHILALAVGILVTWVFAYLISLFVITAVFSSPPDWKFPSFAYTAACICALTGPAAWVLFMNRINRRRITATIAQRHARLKSLARVPEFRERLPHRALELSSLAYDLPSDELKSVLESVSPGIAIVGHPSANPRPACPMAISVSFEPIPLARLAEELHLKADDYDNWDAQSTGLGLSSDAPSLDGSLHRIWRSIRDWAGLGFAIALLTGLLGVALYLTCTGILGLVRGRPNSATLIVVAVGAWYAFPAVLRLMVGRSWWAVPGGLIYREHKLWRRRCTGDIITRESSPLYLDTLSEVAAVVTKAGVLSFQIDADNAMALLSAWQARAAPPTREEVLSFLGIG